MDYARIYEQLIADRMSNPPVGYSENHHIVPKSMGGSDEPENLVRLSPRDHFYAHLLLAKIHGGTQWCAVIAMTMSSQWHDRNFAVAASLYDKARREVSRAMTGRKHSEEAIRKIAAASKGRVPWNKGLKTKGHKNYAQSGTISAKRGPMGEAHKSAISRAKTGSTQSEDHRKNIAASVKRKHACPVMREKISAASRLGRAKARRERAASPIRFWFILVQIASAANS